MYTANSGFRKLLGILILIAAMYFVTTAPSVVSWGPINNYRNVSVRTTVNVTEAYPEILNITCGTGSSITLTAGSNTTVVCRVQIRDYNGGGTITQDNGSVVNGTFFYALNLSNDPDEPNVHYTNGSCSQNGSANGFYVNWTCAFDVAYFANNGTWRVNVTVMDPHNGRNLNTSALFNTSIAALYALNVTDVIDYGQLFVGDTSPTPVQANVTNFGNMMINVSVYAYGGENPVTGAGLAMICEQRNITISNERFSTNGTLTFDDMSIIAGSPQMLQNFSIPKQTLVDSPMVNATYWALHVNISTNPYGICNGTVVFSAFAS